MVKENLIIKHSDNVVAYAVELEYLENGDTERLGEPHPITAIDLINSEW